MFNTEALMITEDYLKTSGVSQHEFAVLVGKLKAM
jgi:hypothetical protein